MKTISVEITALALKASKNSSRLKGMAENLDFNDLVMIKIAEALRTGSPSVTIKLKEENDLPN